MPGCQPVSAAAQASAAQRLAAAAAHPDFGRSSDGRFRGAAGRRLVRSEEELAPVGAPGRAAGARARRRVTIRVRPGGEAVLFKLAGFVSSFRSQCADPGLCHVRGALTAAGWSSLRGAEQRT